MKDTCRRNEKKSWTEARMQRFLNRFSGVCLTLAAFTLLCAVPSFAEGRWEQKGKDWYYYETEAASTSDQAVSDGTENRSRGDGGTPETKKSYTGWVLSQNNYWFYVADSRMQTGWLSYRGDWYYLLPGGDMAVNRWIGNFYCGEDGKVLRSTTTPDGYSVDQYGCWIKNGKSVEKLDEKTALYVKVLAEHPDARPEFTTPATLLWETNPSGYRCAIFKHFRLYDRATNVLLYSGDGVFHQNAVIEVKEEDMIRSSNPNYFIENHYLMGGRVTTDPSGVIIQVYAE